MRVMVDFCLVPIGVGVSVSEHVAECERLIESAGLSAQLHPYGTVVEGEWDEVFAVIRRCHERVHEMGAARISSSLRVGTRTDKAQTMQDKIDSVNEKLGRN